MEPILMRAKKGSEIIIKFQILRAKVVDAKLIELAKDGSDSDVEF
jgi:hypothetical protein